MSPLPPPPPPPPVEAVAPGDAGAFLPGATRERVDPGEEVVDFNRGDWDLKVRLGFSGNSYSPLTLFTAFFNWFDLQLAADHGIYEREYLTIGVGFEAFAGRPLIPELTAGLRADSGANLDWRAATHGVAGRLTVHYTWLSSLDPYGVFLLGPTIDTVRGARQDRAASGRFVSAGLRTGLGAGVSLVNKDRIMGGVELRYLVAPRFRSGSNVPIPASDGTVLDQFDVGRAQRPPRGLSWVFYVGMRL